MPLPLPEDPSDEFTFDDWQELLAAADPAGGDVMSADGMDATLIGRIPGNKVRSALAFFLGYSYTPDNGKQLYRLLPASHPIWPWLYVKSVQFHRRHPSLNPDGIEPSVPAIGDSVIEKTSYYLSAYVTLHFAPRPYDLLEDADTIYEYERFCNIYETTDPNLETISAGVGRYLTFTEGDPAATTFPGDVTEYKISTALTIAWDQVAEGFIYDGRGYPQKIIRAVGCVNHDDFLGWPRGTLLCLPPRFRRYPQPVRTDDGYKLFAVDVKLTFAAFDPEPAVGYDNSNGRGWQLMPWINGGNVNDTLGPGGVGWYHVSRPDGSDFLPYYNFTKIFEGVSVP